MAVEWKSDSEVGKPSRRAAWLRAHGHEGYSTTFRYCPASEPCLGRPLFNRTSQITQVPTHQCRRDWHSCVLVGIDGLLANVVHTVPDLFGKLRNFLFARPETEC